MERNGDCGNGSGLWLSVFLQETVAGWLNKAIRVVITD
jgi:hypothetical protein